MTTRLATSPPRTPRSLKPPPPPPPLSSPSLVVADRPGRLVTVTGRLDSPGLEQLAAVLGEDTAFLALDLSAVTDCGTGLFAVLAHTHTRLRARQGRLRLIGLSPAVLAALDHAPIQEILIVYLTSDRAPDTDHSNDHTSGGARARAAPGGVRRGAVRTST